MPSAKIQQKQEIRIIGTGLAVPPVVTNQDVVDMLPDLGITMKWLEKNVGITQRHVSIDGMGRTSTTVPRAEFKQRTNLRAAPGCCNSDLCAKAIQDAAHHATMLSRDHSHRNNDDNEGAEVFSLDQIDMIIVTTVTPDVPVPATATFVMEKLGLNNVQVMDIRSACCGFTIGLQNAIAYLQAAPNPFSSATDEHATSTTITTSLLDIKTVAVVGCEVGSVYGNLDPKHPKFERGDAVNAAMIGDAASCVIVRRFDTLVGSDCEKANDGDTIGCNSSSSSGSSCEVRHFNTPFGLELLHVETRCIGNGKEPGMHIPCGGCIQPFSQQVFDDGGHFFHHDFKKVLEHGAELYFNSIQNGLKALGKNRRFQEIFLGHTNNGKNEKLKPSDFREPSIADIDLFIPHQANGRITSYGTKMGVAEEKLHEHFSTFGNTANASLPIGIYLESRRRVRNKKALNDKSSSSISAHKSGSSIESDQFFSTAFRDWEKFSPTCAKNAILQEDDVVICLAAESTKWLHGTICLVWHSMIPKELRCDGEANNKNNTSLSNNNGIKNKKNNAFSLSRMKANLQFVVIGWLLYYLKYITAFLAFFGIGTGEKNHKHKRQ